MNATYVQQGDSIDYTPTSAVAAGTVVVLGKLVGIAKLDIPANTLGALALRGVFAVAKADATAFAMGDNVYFDTATGLAVTDTSKTYLGKAVKAAVGAADTGDVTVRVVLLDGDRVLTAADAIADLAAEANAATIVTALNTVLAALRSAGVIDAE